MNYNDFCMCLFSLMNDPCYKGEPWVVYFKCRNADGDIEEHYEVFAPNFDNNCIDWFNDWYEGQTNIDICGAYNIEGLVKEERK